MGKKALQVLNYVFFLGLGIGLTIFLYNKMSPDQKAKFLESIKSANYIYFLPIIIMSLSSHLVRALRWRILIEPLGFAPNRAFVFHTVMAGYLINTFVPRAGEIAKCTFLGKRKGIPIDQLIGTIIVERIFDLISFFIIILLAIAVQYELIGNFIADSFAELRQNTSATTLLAYMFVIIGIIVLLSYFLKRYKNNKFVSKARNIVQGIKKGLLSVRQIKNWPLFLGYSVLMWTLYLMQIYVGFSALPSISYLGIDAALAILTAGSLAMIVTPGGIGAFPLAVANVLFLYGVNEDSAEGQAFGYIIWGATTAITIIFGLISTFWIIITKPKNNEVSAISSK
jgi:glycosyltransferase 2 family protein